MNEDRNTIIIIIIIDGESSVVKTYLNEYRNLMVLLNENYFIENFGECGGQGRCATCLVKVTGLHVDANKMDRNEAVTIGKINLPAEGIRLSCQLLINMGLNGAVIEL